MSCNLNKINVKKNMDAYIFTLFDKYAINILMYVSKNPKTRSELIHDLNIPQATLYKKITNLTNNELVFEIKSKRKQDYRYVSDVDFITIQNFGSKIKINLFNQGLS